MTVTITNAALPDLAAACRTLDGLPLPPKAALAIARLSVALAPYAETYDRVRYDALVRHAEKDEGGRLRVEGGAFLFATPEDREAFEAEMAPVLSETVRVDVEPITAADLGSAAVPPAALRPLVGVLFDAPKAAAEPSGDGQPADGVAVPTLTPNGDA